MNWKSTAFLIVLLGAGASAWWWLSHREGEAPVSPTLAYFKDALTSDKLTRVEVVRGKDTRFVLERTGQEWSLPGKWPTRPQETKAWIERLTSLNTRFQPVPLDDKADLKPYGLADNPLIIKVTCGDETHTLRFAAEPGGGYRYARPTYVRLDEKPEVIRLGDDLLAELDRTIDHFRKLSFFPYESVPKEEDSREKIDQLLADEVEFQSASHKLTLAKVDGAWRLKEAFEKKDNQWQTQFANDRVEEGKLKAFLVACADLGWAGKSVDNKNK